MAENIENSSYEEIIKKADEFSKQKNYKEEIKLYKIAMVMFADKLDKTKLISLYIKLGNAYYNLDNRDKSTQYYEEYLKLHPQGQSSVFSRLSHAYYYTDTDKSIDYHNKALNLQPNKYDVTSKLVAMMNPNMKRNQLKITFSEI